MTTNSININLAEARQNLPELVDRAHAGQTFVLARRGRKLAVIIGIDEYHRLKQVEREQREHDFDILLAPPGIDVMSEDEARDLTQKAVRKVRASRHSTQSA